MLSIENINKGLLMIIHNETVPSVLAEQTAKYNKWIQMGSRRMSLKCPKHNGMWGLVFYLEHMHQEETHTHIYTSA